MANDFTRGLFLNLPVKDLERAKAFFGGLGFSFNPQFTDDKAACMVLNDNAFVMLLVEDYFRTFTKLPTPDTRKTTAGTYAVSCASREEVDEMVNKAAATGGARALDFKDHGFMYAGSFYDPDGHQWEVLWMDPKALAQ